MGKTNIPSFLLFYLFLFLCVCLPRQRQRDGIWTGFLFLLLLPFFSWSVPSSLCPSFTKPMIYEYDFFLPLPCFFSRTMYGLLFPPYVMGFFVFEKLLHFSPSSFLSFLFDSRKTGRSERKKDKSCRWVFSWRGDGEGGRKTQTPTHSRFPKRKRKKRRKKASPRFNFGFCHASLPPPVPLDKFPFPPFLLLSSQYGKSSPAD